MHNIDTWRRIHLAVAEWVDAWRVIPRILIAAYSYLVWFTITWYMALKPYMLEDCIVQDMANCIIAAPSTQHAALVTAVVGVSAAVFGLYSNSGKKWNGFTKWNNDFTGTETKPGFRGIEKPPEPTPTDDQQLNG